MEGSFDGKNFRHDSPLVKGQDRQGKRQAKTPPAAGTGIDPKRLAPPFQLRAVRMTETDYPHRALPPVRDVLPPMDQTERDTVDLDGRRIRQRCKLAAIRIAPDRRDRYSRRNLGQPSEDLRRADVPRMKNPVAPGKQLKHPGAQQAVSVGKQTDAHRGGL